MLSLWQTIQLRFSKVLNIVLMSLPFCICWFAYYDSLTVKNDSFISEYMIVVIFYILYTIYGKVYDAFLISYIRISELVYSQLLAALLADGICYCICCLVAGEFLWLIPWILCIIGQTVISMTWCILTHIWYFHAFSPKKTIIVYDMREGMEKLIRDYEMSKKFDVIATYQVKEALSTMDVIFDGVECLFLSGIHSHERNIFLKYCIFHNIRCYMIPRLGDVIMSGAKGVHIFHLPVLWVGRYNPTPEYLIVKRVFDIFVSCIAMVVLSPLMLLCVIAIRSDGGPALYRQIRLTKDGKEFQMLKFRSMRIDAEKDGVARLSTGNFDERITPVGRLLRKTRADELPQLLNILKGDMSIVGPRPERPEIAIQYETIMPEFALRLQAKAGLTGLAQVYGQYNTTPYDKLNMDLMYIANPSIMRDLRICFATVKILFLPDSTEGIKTDQTTAVRSFHDELDDVTKKKRINEE